MPVKKTRDPFLELHCVTRLAHGNRVIEQVPLNLRGQVIPLHDHCRTKAS
jgi:hypothetical protein